LVDLSLSYSDLSYFSYFLYLFSLVGHCFLNLIIVVDFWFVDEFIVVLFDLGYDLIMIIIVD